MGRILSGWMSDHLGRINVLRLMIGISMVAMPILYARGRQRGGAVRDAVHRLLVLWHPACP
jgi:nitrate/nitrite transporter NarK